LNPSGSALLYSTYFGGDDAELGVGVAVDAAGHAYLSGTSSSENMPTRNPFQTAKKGLSDLFVAKFADASLVYATYIGGSGPDFGNGVAVDAAGNAHVTGVTFSSDYPNCLVPSRWTRSAASTSSIIRPVWLRL